MTINSSYGQFCPVAIGAELVCNRWTPLILRELLSGSARFNELRKGLPRISPALLAKRLKELEASRILNHDAQTSTYSLTEAGESLRPIVMALGFWAQSWIDSEVSLRNLDPTLLMWDMRRRVSVASVPAGRQVIQFLYRDVSSSQRRYWLVIGGDGDTSVDLCFFDPGFDVDLWVECDLRTMTMIWMGLSTIEGERRAGRLLLDGDPSLAGSMQDWLGLSPFAGTPRRSVEAVRLAAAV